MHLKERSTARIWVECVNVGGLDVNLFSLVLR